MKNLIKQIIKYKKIIVILLLVFVMIVFISKNNNLNASESIEEIGVIEPVNIEIEEDINTVKVDIKGEVNLPGVYELEEGSRVIDVINLSNGLTINADTKNVNLAKILIDEMVIYIPNKNEEVEVIENIDSPNNLININKASLDELLNITGIGESKARAIIEYRKENPFLKVEDIMNISGIGESVFNKIKDEITI